MKKGDLSRGMRFFLGSTLVLFLSLGLGLGWQIFFQRPPAETFTLPAIPADPMTLKADFVDASAANFSPPYSDVESVPSVADPVPRLPAPNEVIRSTRPAVPQHEFAKSKEPGDSFESAASSFRETPSPADPVNTPGDGNFESAEALTHRLARDPQNEDILVTLADQLFVEGNPTEAWELIARTGRLNDSRFVSRLMRFGLAAARADETLVILDVAGDTLPDFSTGEWLFLVRLHEATGQLDRAIEIANLRVKDRCELFRLRARQANRTGKIDEAILNQEQYLTHAAEAPAGEWQNLAVWYESAGRSEEAMRASRQAEGAGRLSPAGKPR